MTAHQHKQLRVLFWGMDGLFSRLVLDGLIKEGIRPIGIVVAAFYRGDSLWSINQVLPQTSAAVLPLLNPYIHKSIYQVAWEKDIPLFNVHDLNAEETLHTLRKLQPTIGIVACFPSRIPMSILSLPPFGFLNLHPSLLPMLRGPYPLFWTIRLDIQPGITLHFMDEGLDTGDIVAQKAVEFPDGISGAQADLLTADAGTSMLITSCRELEKGSISKIPQQGESSTYSKPQEGDFSIPSSWSARRAFNFIRGTEEWGQPYLIQGAGFQLRVRTAVSYNQKSFLFHPFQKNGADIWIGFSPGTLHARQ